MMISAVHYMTHRWDPEKKTQRVDLHWRFFERAGHHDPERIGEAYVKVEHITRSMPRPYWLYLQDWSERAFQGFRASSSETSLAIRPKRSEYSARAIRKARKERERGMRAMTLLQKASKIMLENAKQDVTNNRRGK